MFSVNQICLFLPKEYGGKLIIRREVLEHFWKNRQKGFFSLEAGGQLFAILNDERNISVQMATGPHLKDRRKRNSYTPHIPSHQADIHRLYCKGLHFVGEWHTHREKTPKPSTDDLTAIRDAFEKDEHDLLAYILIIIGLENTPKGIKVFMQSNKDFIELKACV